MPASGQNSLLFGLVVCVALAAGYVAGRLHGITEESVSLQPGVPTTLATRGSSRENAANRGDFEPRAGLNPQTIQVLPRTTGGAISRYPNPGAAPQESGEVALNYGPDAIGEFSDPDALEIEREAHFEVQNIGEFLDPDGIWPDDEGRRSIGEYMEPQILDAGY